MGQVILELFARFMAYCFPSKEMLDAEAVAREWDIEDGKTPEDDVQQP